MQAIGDLSRHSLRSEKSVPDARIQSRLLQHFGDRRHVRRGARAFRRADRERTNLAALDVRQRRRKRRHVERDLAADHIRHRLRGALVRDGDDVQSELALDDFDVQMARRADAR